MNEIWISILIITFKYGGMWEKNVDLNENRNPRRDKGKGGERILLGESVVIWSLSKNDHHMQCIVSLN